MTSSEDTVLVVDDDERCRQLHQLWLSEAFEVRTAGTGREALDAVDGEVDVVVLDRQMPGLSGEDVFERLRAGRHEPGIVMVSTLEQAGVEPDAYLRKPVTSEVLTAAVATVADACQVGVASTPERRGI